MAAAQLEFDFGEQQEERAVEKTPPALPRFDAPRNDNERLLNCQWAYKTLGDRSALEEMYKLGRTVALKFINAEARKNGRVRALRRADREEKAHNAITYVIARYLRVKGFAVRKSLTAYLYLRVRHELYYRRKVDEIVAFVDAAALKGV